MRRLMMLAIVATLAATSCSSDEATSITAPAAQADSGSKETDPSVAIGTEAGAPEEASLATTPAPENADQTPDPAPTTTDVVSEDDLTLFITAAERSLEGTSQESAVFDDPEIYIALGQASCDRFSAGATFEQIATDILADIDTDDSNDETRLVGAILGAATQTLCPEHADRI
jgi:hypothetical protein